MIRICIVTRKMVMGGVERALLTLLDSLRCAYNDVEVDLCLQQSGGELYDQIPEWVCIRKLHSISKEKAIHHPIQAVRKLLICSSTKHFNMSYAEQCFIFSKVYAPMSKNYDIAISYHAPNTIPVFYVIDKVRAQKKILWIHATMEENSGAERVVFQYHEKYDQVICVSKSAYDSFVKLHPLMKQKTKLRYNLINKKRIKDLALNGKKFPHDNQPVLLTIGRLEHQKGIDIAVDACEQLVKQGHVFKWYVCGEGNEHLMLSKMICERNLNDVFILMGNQMNPYGYLDSCDLYIQPSRFEGYCTATVEAKVLGKPVITTDVSGAREQFGDNISGWIVPISSKAIALQIEWCLDHMEEVEIIGRAQSWNEHYEEGYFDFLWENNG